MFLAENEIFSYSRVLKDRPLFEERLPLSVAISLPVIPDIRSSDAGFLNEGIPGIDLDLDLIKDLVQFALSGAVQYGLTATVAGAPAAPVAESMVDSMFAAESISGALSTIKSATSSAGKFAIILNNMMAAKSKISSGDFWGFYKIVRSIIRNGLNLLGQGATETIDKLAQELSDMVSGMIDKTMDAATKGLKLLIPDATLGLGISTTIKKAASATAENFFTLISMLFKVLGKYAEFLYNPDAAKDFFNTAFDKIIEALLAIKEKIEDAGYLESILASGGNITGGIVLKKLGPTGIQKAVDVLKEKLPIFLEMVDNVVSIIFPMTAALFAAIQVLLKGEYKEKEKEKGKKSSEGETEFKSKTTASESKNLSLSEAIFDQKIIRKKKKLEMVS